MLYHKDVDGDREYVHIFDEDKLKICFEALADTTNSGMCKSRSGKQAYHSGDTPGGCAQKSTGFAAFQA